MKNATLLIAFLMPLLPVLVHAEQAPERILLMDLKATLIEEEVVGLISNMITSELALHREFELITGKDMRQMVELEAGKQAMGCSDDNSCIAELAGAMGARFVIFGEMGKLGTFNLLSLNLFDSQKAKAAGRVSLRAKTIDGLVEQLPSSIDRLLEETKSRQKEPLNQAAVQELPGPPSVTSTSASKTDPQIKATQDEELLSPSLVSGMMAGAGVGLAALGVLSTTLGGWGLTSVTAILNSNDSTASQRELAIVAYRGAPGFILAGMASVLGGATVLLMPHSKETEE